MSDTQTRDVLKYLETGKPLSARVASRLLYIERLAARIYDLRASGYNVVASRRNADRGAQGE